MLDLFSKAAATSAQNTHLMFWQKTSYPEELRSVAFFQQKADYIRNNPVVAALVTEPEHYAWSSAHPSPVMIPDEA